MYTQLIEGGYSVKTSLKAWIIDHEDLIDSRREPPDDFITGLDRNVASLGDDLAPLDGGPNVGIRRTVLRSDGNGVSEQVLEHVGLLLPTGTGCA